MKLLKWVEIIYTQTQISYRFFTEEDSQGKKSMRRWCIRLCIKREQWPDAFKRIEGGILQAAKLYTDVHKAIDEFAYDAKGRRG